MEIIFDASIGGRTSSALSFRRLGKRCNTAPGAEAAIPIIYILIISFSNHTIKRMQKAQYMPKGRPAEVSQAVRQSDGKDDRLKKPPCKYLFHLLCIRVPNVIQFGKATW